MTETGADTGPGVPVAGWYPDPWHQFPLRWWNGQLWTNDVASDGWTGLDQAARPTAATQRRVRVARRPVDPKWNKVGAVIVALEMATFTLGLISVIIYDPWPDFDNRSEYYAYVCDGNRASEVVSGATWLAWLGFFILALTLVVLWAVSFANGRSSLFLVISAFTSLGVAVMVFPGWLVFGTGMDCGM